MNLLNSKGFIINPIVQTIHIMYTNKFTISVPTEKSPPLTLSKAPLKQSTVSLESSKAPSKISSTIPLETPLTEPFKSPKNPYTPVI